MTFPKLPRAKLGVTFGTVKGFFFLLFCYAAPSYADWVQINLKDKGQNELIVNDKALSKNAIQKRLKQRIPFDEKDIPIYRDYLFILEKSGVSTQYYSRWFNCIWADLSTSQIKNVERFSFVKNVEMTVVGSIATCREQWQNRCQEPLANPAIQQLDLPSLHQNGFTGKGIKVAVFDDGYKGSKEGPILSRIFANHQVLGTKDFLTGFSDVYHTGGHGTATWSQMAAFHQDLRGAAPDANYYLARTEIDSVEIPLEMALWVMAAEWADSLGADIISSSLGYSQFDDPTADHYYGDMDGKTTLVSRGAQIASEKGILVVNSAGNEGQRPWRFISAPADAPGVLAVGAVDQDRQMAPFSSRGPSWDGRIKPDVVAMGAGNLAVFTNGALVRSNGTSFSCPLVAGLAACLWQSNPNLTSVQLFNILKETADKAENPNNDEGWGLPSGLKGYEKIHGKPLPPSIPCQLLDPSGYRVFPNPFYTTLNLTWYNPPGNPSSFTLTLLDMAGQSINEMNLQAPEGLVSRSWSVNVASGIYLLQLKADGIVYFQEKVMRLP